jgi:transposase
MERYQAYRFELRPTGEQERAMRRFAGSCRFVYNKALALQKENHAAGNKFISYVTMAKYLTAWRNSSETPWLSDTPCSSSQQALIDLDRAFKNFFEKRAGFPKFKRKGNGWTKGSGANVHAWFTASFGGTFGATGGLERTNRLLNYRQLCLAPGSEMVFTCCCTWIRRY